MKREDYDIATRIDNSFRMVVRLTRKHMPGEAKHGICTTRRSEETWHDATERLWSWAERYLLTHETLPEVPWDSPGFDIDSAKPL